jgi:phosphatidylinositol-3-phosphatase
MGRRVVTAILAAAVLGAVAPAPVSAALPPVKHVFVILLENENADSTFGPESKAPYLARELPARGLLIPEFYAVTHLSLGNYIALVSGQGSNVATQSDCQTFQEFAPGTIGADGQALGQGCVYPAAVTTLADQLTAKGLTWKGYMEDMITPCRHPAIGAHDETQEAKQGDQYAARHNPFVYFHSIIDSPACAQNDVPLDRLAGDLRSERTTASYSFITPNLCNDGHDEPCVTGEPGGLTSADVFLRIWVPRITRSPAFRAGGVLIVSFDEAENEGPDPDASACCDQPQFPNTLNNGGPVPGRGGGRIGTVILSPFVKPGSITQTPYNHFSLLRSVEDLFGLDHLGYAARPELRSFGADVFGAGPPRLSSLRVRPGRFRATGRGRRSPRRAIVTYDLSMPAQVSFRVDRCARRHRARCTRWKRVRNGFTRRALAGENATRWGGRLRGRPLRAGRYRLVASASGYGGRSATARRGFRILAR